MSLQTFRLKYSLFLLFVVLCGAGRLQAVNRPAGGVIVTPLELQLKGDSLYIELSIGIYAEAMNPRQSWSIIPRLVSEPAGNQQPLPYLLINGKIKEKHYKRRYSYGESLLLSFLPSVQVDIPLKRDTVLYYRQVLPRQAWMEQAALEIHQVLTSSAGKEQVFTIGKVAHVENVQPEVQIEEEIAYTVAPVVEEIEEVQEKRLTVRLDFPKGSTEILPFYGENQQKLAEIHQWFEEMKRTRGLRVQSISITGYASPEGMYITNEGLALGRARAFMDYLRRQFGLSPYLFRVSGVAEDWEGLRQMVEESWMAQRYEILRIIDQVGIFEGRELRLMQLDRGEPYREMLHYMFPELRRVEVLVEWTIEN
ncbi:MAG: DUF3868 domain-containing protein [Tannerellaceae bacterium]|nr:DUF3868 domain-containing protein [Tannerellaceae bacterium]